MFPQEFPGVLNPSFGAAVTEARIIVNEEWASSSYLQFCDF